MRPVVVRPRSRRRRGRISKPSMISHGWRIAKGRSDDPEAMLLLARAQSLSGRPGDALVMLNRLAARGVPTDAATSEDFAGVRALPSWSGEKASAEVLSRPAADPPAAVPPKAPEKRPTDPVVTPRGSNSTTPPPAKPVAPTPGDPEPPPAKAPAAPVVSPPAASTTAPSPSPASGFGFDAPRPVAPLKFTTVLTPSALAYDGVSRRFIIADRAARRIAVIDEQHRPGGDAGWCARCARRHRGDCDRCAAGGPVGGRVRG